MAKLNGGKKVLAIAVMTCLCVTLLTVPAIAMWYVHNDDHVANSDGRGVDEICLTLDASAIGQGVHVEQIFVPSGSTAEACLTEGIRSSNSQNGLKAIHNYGYSDLKSYLKGKKWTCTVHKAESQKPGTQTKYDSKGETGTDVSLERFDSVVITVTK